jgi:HemY protein
MKRTFILLITFLLAIICALYMMKDQGYIFLTYKNIIIEFSLWTGVGLLLLSFIITHQFINFIKFCLDWPTRSKNFWQQHQQQKSYMETSLGLLKLAEGNFKQAYNLLNHSAELQKKPLINYLTAAKAAQELGDISKRDECLRKAFECSPKSGLSIGIMQAELQCYNHEYEAALATLYHLQQKYGVNKLVLKQLLQVYINLKDWHKLIKLLPELKRYKIISPEEILEYEVMAAKNYYTEAVKNLNVNKIYTKNIDEHYESELEALYNQELTKQARGHYKVIVAYVKSLLLNQNRAEIHSNHELKLLLTNKSITIIEKALLLNNSKEAEHELIILLGLIAYTEEHFKRIEKFVKNNSHNLDLLFILGKLAINLEQYEKAYQYLNQASRLIEKSNTDLPIDNYLSFVLLKLGREQEGLELFMTTFA